jgi:hypothetical protein
MLWMRIRLNDADPTGFGSTTLKQMLLIRTDAGIAVNTGLVGGGYFIIFCRARIREAQESIPRNHLRQPTLDGFLFLSLARSCPHLL